MITDLKLSGNELILYALIHGFSQDGDSHFFGSLNYMATALNVTRANAKKIVGRLIEKGLVRKREFESGGVKYCNYKTTYTERCYQNDNRGGILSVGGGTETIPYNKDINNKDNNTERKSDDEIIAEKREKFRQMCEPYIPKYGEQMINAFITYWTEANGRRLRWEVKKAESGAFEVGRRLGNWASKDYNKPTINPQQPSRPQKPIWEQMGLSYDDYVKYINSQK